MTYSALITLILSKVGSEHITSHITRAKELFVESIYEIYDSGQFSDSDFVADMVIVNKSVTVSPTGSIPYDITDLVNFVSSTPYKVLGVYSSPSDPAIYVKKSIDYVGKALLNSELDPIGDTRYYYETPGTIWFYPAPATGSTYTAILKCISKLPTLTNDTAMRTYFKAGFLYRVIAITAEKLYAEINR
jgi:hypothetical protein